MERLLIEATEQTPYVCLDKETTTFEISGRSIPKDAEAFYDVILNWLDEYKASPATQTKFTFDLDCFNISTSKRILFILYKLNEIFEANHDVTVRWVYSAGDDDMLEVGQDFAYMVKVPFEFCQVGKKVKTPHGKANDFTLAS